MRKRISRRKLIAIIDALTFVEAGERDAESHDPNGDFEGALAWALQELARLDASAA